MITSTGSIVKEGFVCFILLCLFVFGSLVINLSIIDIVYLGFLFIYMIRYSFIKKKKNKLYGDLV